MFVHVFPKARFDLTLNQKILALVTSTDILPDILRTIFNTFNKDCFETDPKSESKSSNMRLDLLRLSLTFVQKCILKCLKITLF